MQIHDVLQVGIDSPVGRDFPRRGGPMEATPLLEATSVLRRSSTTATTAGGADEEEGRAAGGVHEQQAARSRKNDDFCSDCSSYCTEQL